MKIKMLVSGILLACLCVPAALANPPKPPTTRPPSMTVKPAHLTRHGLIIRLKLNATVTDGQPAQFSLTIAKAAGQTARYVVAGMGWSFDGREPRDYQYATPTDLNATNGVQYVDQARHWFRVGNLSAGQVFHLDGKVQVPDRTQAHMRNAQFFCIRAYVYSALPGHPNSAWGEQSNMACAQYSVS